MGRKKQKPLRRRGSGEVGELKSRRVVVGSAAWMGASHVALSVRYPMSLSRALSFSGPSVLGHPRDMGQPLPGPNIDLDETGRENLPPARPGVIGAGLPWSARPSASQARRPGVLTLGSGGRVTEEEEGDGNDDGDGTH
ncbi:hypothetical protein GQ607_001934 [Colletotrichum asianum]|uniref:Uncharacterized protein n=1 Tax=Colletotrichum asianum TaxID=702518 RepID=A0A8H3WPC8_9PEZI|nr:hypothetical protein GQ607_001934 [Colletotrichum asianum]